VNTAFTAMVSIQVEPVNQSDNVKIFWNINIRVQSRTVMIEHSRTDVSFVDMIDIWSHKSES